jgi:hypothetical protein
MYKYPFLTHPLPHSTHFRSLRCTKRVTKTKHVRLRILSGIPLCLVRCGVRNTTLRIFGRLVSKPNGFVHFSNPYVAVSWLSTLQRVLENPQRLCYGRKAGERCIIIPSAILLHSTSLLSKALITPKRKTMTPCVCFQYVYQKQVMQRHGLQTSKMSYEMVRWFSVPKAWSKYIQRWQRIFCD